MSEDTGGVFTIAASDAAQRLDVYLTARLACSRARVQQGIAAGDVLVNGRMARASYKLRAGDGVEADLPDVVVAAIVPEDLPLSVLYEDEALIVIDKPAGLVVHPAGDITRGTLANALAHRFGAEPRLVHRLDRDTSGVMVVARTLAAQDALIAQFRERTVSKHYVTLVHGRPAARQGSVAAPIDRDRKNRLKMTVCPPGEGREALTRYEVLAQWPEFALLAVEIKTGRTHQIRVHCAHLCHPVVADEMYGKGRTGQLQRAEIRAAVLALGRQFLHAARLCFDDPRTGVRHDIRAPMPADLLALLATIKQGEPPEPAFERW